jgi:molecular chaperone GrpE (heat shock protein)
MTLEALLRAVASSSQPVPGLEPLAASTAPAPTVSSPPPVKVEKTEAAEIRPEKAVEAKPEKAVEAKPEKTVEAKPEKTVEAKPEKTVEAKPEKAVEAKTEKTGEIRPERAIERAEKSERVEKTERVEKSEKVEKNDKTDKSDRNDAGTSKVNLPTPARGSRITPAPKTRAATPPVQTSAARPAPPPASPAPAPAPVVHGLSAKDREQIRQDVLDSVKHGMKASVEPLARGLDTSNANIGKLVKALEALAVEAQKRRKDYDVLYDEMRDYKANFVETAQRPLYMDLLLLFDALQRAERVAEETREDQIPKATVKASITQVKDQLLEILYRRDIEPITEHPTKLDVKFQKPVRRIEVADPAEDRTVAQVVREGFRRSGAVLRPQEVVVRRHVNAPSDEGAGNGSTEAGEMASVPAAESPPTQAAPPPDPGTANETKGSAKAPEPDTPA